MSLNRINNNTSDNLKKFLNDYEKERKDVNGRTIKWIKVERSGQQQCLVIQEITIWDRILHFLGIGGFSKQAITEFFIENVPATISNELHRHKKESTKSLISLVYEKLNDISCQSIPAPQYQISSPPSMDLKAAIPLEDIENENIPSNDANSDTLINVNAQPAHASSSKTPSPMPLAANLSSENPSLEIDTKETNLLKALENAKKDSNDDSLNKLINEFNELLNSTRNHLVSIGSTDQYSENTPSDLRLFTRLEALREVKNFFKYSENNPEVNKKSRSIEKSYQ